MRSECRQNFTLFGFGDLECNQSPAQLGRDLVEFGRGNPEIAVRFFKPEVVDPGGSECIRTDRPKYCRPTMSA